MHEFFWRLKKIFLHSQSEKLCCTVLASKMYVVFVALLLPMSFEWPEIKSKAISISWWISLHSTLASVPSKRYRRRAILSWADSGCNTCSWSSARATEHRETTWGGKAQTKRETLLKNRKKRDALVIKITMRRLLVVPVLLLPTTLLSLHSFRRHNFVIKKVKVAPEDLDASSSFDWWCIILFRLVGQSRGQYCKSVRAMGRK